MSDRATRHSARNGKPYRTEWEYEVSDKVNIDEAKMMAAAVYRIYKLNEKEFGILGGIKIDVALAPLLEVNVILNARVSPIIKHASSKFKIFIF